MANRLNEQPTIIDTVTAGAGTGSIGAASAAIAAANPDRQYIRIQNTHASQTLSLGFGTDAVAGRGIVLIAGASWEMPPHSIFTGAINGIGSGVATTLAYVEW